MSASYIWNFFKQKGLTDQGVAGLMGNLFAESSLNPKNLQQTYEKVLHMTDNSYTKLVDCGLYLNFVQDCAGYGLAQWTHWSRKQKLLDFAKKTNRSIGSLEMQTEFLWEELVNSFPRILNTLKTSNDILECSNIVLFEFERPADMSEKVQQTRADYALNYYNMFSAKEGLNTIQSKENTKADPIINCTVISPNRTSPRWYEIDTVTIHCVVGQTTAQALGEYFANPQRRGSSNYGIGQDGSIGLYVPEEDRAWTSGGVDINGNEIFVNGISGFMNDHRAITIEVSSDHFYPYAVTDAAMEGLIKLLVDICTRYPKIHRLRWQADKSLVGNTELQNMTAHRWFANTECPGDYLYERFGDIAKEVNRRLDNNQLQIDTEEDDDMTIERFKELWKELRDTLQDNEASQWSEEARAWAISNGLVQGGGDTPDGEPNFMWEDLMTREQFVTVLYRFSQMMDKHN
jgi:hypothetical protein